MTSEAFTKIKELQPTNLMPHITRQELCNDFDSILQRIDKENIGYVIEDEGKESLVLCPANWFSYCFDEKFGDVMISAVRYALLQDGVIPGNTADFIRRYLDTTDIRTLETIKIDITQALNNHDSVPVYKCWELLLSDIQQRIIHSKGGEIMNYPTERELDGIYFKVERNGIMKNICFSDMTADERKQCIASYDAEALRRMCIHFSDVIQNIGEQFNLKQQTERK